MIDLGFSIVVIAAGLVLCSTFSSMVSKSTGKLIYASYLAHLVSATVQIWLYWSYYGYGDMRGYYRRGCQLADLIRYDPIGMAPAALLALLQQDHGLPPSIAFGGPQTISLTTMTGLCCLLFSNSLYATSFTFCIWSFCGKFAMFRVFRARFPASMEVPIVCCTMLVPSVVFWSSGVIKETVAFGGLGLLIWSFDRLLRRRSNGLLITLGVGVIGGLAVGLIKAYLLFPTALGFGVWSFLGNAKARGRISYFALARGLVLSGVLVGVLSVAFPEFALGNIAIHVATLQENTQGLGGSAIEFGNVSAKTLGAQLILAPQAAFNAIFRPTIFDIRNPLMAINAIETTALTMVLMFAVVRFRPRWILKCVLRSPVLGFALIFVAVTSVSVGLGTTNLGPLSRYRMPLVPFLCLLLTIWIAPIWNQWIGNTPALQSPTSK